MWLIDQLHIKLGLSEFFLQRPFDWINRPVALKACLIFIRFTLLHFASFGSPIQLHYKIKADLKFNKYCFSRKCHIPFSSKISSPYSIRRDRHIYNVASWAFVTSFYCPVFVAVDTLIYGELNLSLFAFSLFYRFTLPFIHIFAFLSIYDLL
jgi:hypothetical protein